MIFGEIKKRATVLNILRFLNIIKDSLKFSKQLHDLSLRDIYFILKKPRISKKYNCIFIHIPKCAGTSMDFVIFKKPIAYFCKFKKRWTQHATAIQIRDEYSSSLEWNNFFKFSFVRNPFDRALSSYKWLSAQTNLWNGKKLEITKEGFKDFVFRRGVFKNILDEKLEYEEINRYHQIKPQFEYLYDGEKMLVDFVGKYENLEHDWGFISQKLKINIKLPHVYKTQEIDYKEFYDEETKHEVERLYKTDLNIFNYKF